MKNSYINGILKQFENARTSMRSQTYRGAVAHILGHAYNLYYDCLMSCSMVDKNYYDVLYNLINTCQKILTTPTLILDSTILDLSNAVDCVTNFFNDIEEVA